MLDTQRQTRLLRLMQLVSPALPVGGFSFSHGFEYAVEAGWIHDDKSAQEWVIGVMESAIAETEIPLVQRCYKAIQEDDYVAATEWNQHALASRETQEFLLAEVEVGKALIRLLKNLGEPIPTEAKTFGFMAAYALAATRWQIPEEDTLIGFLWAWAENQVAAAAKVVPIGQTAGQKILTECVEQIPHVVAHAQTISDENIGMSLPGLAFAGALHETQYSRLFRS